MAGDRNLFSQRAGQVFVERKVVLVGSDYGDNAVLNHIPEVDQIVPPHESLHRKFPRVVGVKFVLIRESDKTMEILGRLRVADFFDGKTEAVCNRLAIAR